MSTVESGLGERGGLLRVVAAAPAMVAGLAVVVWLSAPLDRYAPVPPLVWLALAGLCLSPPGERVVVQVAYGFRRPTGDQLAELRAAVALAKSRTGILCSALDLYVRRGVGKCNAYAAGRRSIAVSADVIVALARNQLTERQVAAILVREIGHMHGGNARHGLAVAWLRAPGRVLVALLAGVLRRIVRRVPTARAGLVLLGPIILVVTAVQGVQQHAWLPLSAMLMVGVLLIVHPLVNAALSRADERSADAYAVACGLGPELAEVLLSAGPATDGYGATAPALHPPTQRRIRDLTAAGSDCH